MNRRVLLIVISAILSLSVYAQKGVLQITLIVKEVVVEFNSYTSKYNVKSMKMSDDSENVVVVYANKWFENVSEQDVVFPSNFPVTPELRGNNISLLLGDEAKLSWEFMVKDKTYLAEFGVGSKLAVKKNKEGKYILLPEETIALLSPSTSEQ